MPTDLSSSGTHPRRHSPPHTWQPRPSSTGPAVNGSIPPVITHKTRSLSLAIGIAFIAVFGALTGANLKEWYQESRTAQPSPLLESITGSNTTTPAPASDTSPNARITTEKEKETLVVAAHANTLRPQQQQSTNSTEIDHPTLGLESRRAILVQQRTMLEGKIAAVREREAADKERKRIRDERARERMGSRQEQER